MVYEDHDEMNLAEEDRLYESDPYETQNFSDTFREQLGDTPDEEEFMTEEEISSAAVPMSETEGLDIGTDEFGEKMPDSSENDIDQESDHPGSHDSPGEE